MSLIRCCCGASNPCGCTVPASFNFTGDTPNTTNLYYFTAPSFVTGATFTYGAAPTPFAGTLGDLPSGSETVSGSSWWAGPYPNTAGTGGATFTGNAYLRFRLQGCFWFLWVYFDGTSGGGSPFGDRSAFGELTTSTGYTCTPYSYTSYALHRGLSVTPASGSLTGTHGTGDITPNVSGNAG